MKKQSGFTLIELIVVIVILGILAAYAVPKYMSIHKEARVAATKGLKGSVLAAIDMVHSVALAQGVPNTSTIYGLDIGGGVIIDIRRLYPDTTNNGIGKAIADVDGFDGSVFGGSSPSIKYTKKGADDITKCFVSYSLPSGSALPSVTSNTDGC